MIKKKSRVLVLVARRPHEKIFLTAFVYLCKRAHNSFVHRETSFQLNLCQCSANRENTQAPAYTGVVTQRYRQQCE